jgi:potassium-transporting ATPase KdpC subunit
MLSMIRNAFMSVVIFTVLTGLLYPLTVTGISQAIFPRQANGSIITKNGRPVGSSLIGQQFADPKYFWGRLSATEPFSYNGGASSGANRGPNNPALITAVQRRIAALRAADPDNTARIPVDLVTASGSGLDPHISPAAASYQVHRISRVRRIDEARVRALVAAHVEDRQFGVLGEPRINVLRLNLALDELDQT